MQLHDLCSYWFVAAVIKPCNSKAPERSAGPCCFFHCPTVYFFCCCCFCARAHESRKVTVRLKTGFSAVWSFESAQK